MPPPRSQRHKQKGVCASADRASSRCVDTPGPRRPTVPKRESFRGTRPSVHPLGGMRACHVRHPWHRWTSRVRESILYDGLTVLQHRGQDAAGMLTEHDGQFILRKSNGQVADVFDAECMSRLLAPSASGTCVTHRGSSSSAEASLSTSTPPTACLAHNGNLTTPTNLGAPARQAFPTHEHDQRLRTFALPGRSPPKGAQPEDRDAAHLDVSTVLSAIGEINADVRGGYACVGLIAGYGLFAFRDPHGIRPWCSVAVRSKAPANGWSPANPWPSALGFQVERDVPWVRRSSSPGHLFSEIWFRTEALAPCISNAVFRSARPDRRDFGLPSPPESRPTPC